MVLMIIKGLFRRYERWNPVHPTYGAFWGMGVGIGCGVGWGPGFGPEVIGYVGAGCGIGFSVGVTLAGVGIGLPSKIIIQAPYNAFLATRSIASELVRSSGPNSMRNVAGDGWNNNIAAAISRSQREANDRFSNLILRGPLRKGIDIAKVGSIISSHSMPVVEGLRTIGSQFSNSDKDSK
ncbi:hypothetical protein Ancab_033080 [Ancistrocladus abbreviatus]